MLPRTSRGSIVERDRVRCKGMTRGFSSQCAPAWCYDYGDLREIIERPVGDPEVSLKRRPKYSLRSPASRERVADLLWLNWPRVLLRPYQGETVQIIG